MTLRFARPQEMTVVLRLRPRAGRPHVWLTLVARGVNGVVSRVGVEVLR